MPGNRPPLPPRLQVGGRPVFVGRRHERRELAAHWDEVVSGRGRAVFIGGEPGAGKTRLAGELASACYDDGATVLAGANARDSGYPLQPFVEMLDHLFSEPLMVHIADDLGRRAVANLALLSPRLARQTDIAAAAPSAFDDPAAIFNAVTDLTRLLAAEAPLVVVLDNLHWAGPHTRKLLSTLVAMSVDQRLLIVATHRTTAPDRSPEVTKSIAELYGMAEVSRIDLGGLGTDEIAEYIAAANGMAGPAARSAAAILRDHTGGNPFFLEETWRDLETGGGIGALVAGELPTPRTVRDVLDLRLGSLAPETIEFLGRAAIAGDEIDLELLYDIGIDPTEVLRSVDDAIAHGFLHETGSGLSFRHTLSRQAAVERIPRHERLRIHADLAEALERRGRRTPEAFAAIAHHYTEAAALGYTEKAVEYLALSGDASRRSLAHREAATLFERAASLATDPRSIELRFHAVNSLAHAGELRDAREQFRELAESPDPKDRARAAIGHEETTWEIGADPSESIRLLVDSMRQLEPGTEDHTRVMASLGRALLISGAEDESRRLASKAIAVATDAGPLDLLGHALMTSICSHARPDELEMHCDRSEQLARIAQQTGNPLHRSMALGAEVNASYRLGDRRLLQDGIQTVRQLAETIGLPFIALSGRCAEFCSALINGRLDEARTVCKQLLSEGRVLGEDNAYGVYGMQSFAVERATGALRSLPSEIVEAASSQGGWKPGLLAVYTERAMTDRAADLLPEVVDTCARLSTISAQWAAVAVFAVEATALVRDTRAAQRLRTMLLPFGGQNLLAGHILLPLGSANRYLAILDHILGDMESATENFEKALEMDRAMGAATHEAETLLSFAAHLEETGERRRADEVRRQGRRIADRIGLRRRIPLEVDASPSVVPGSDLGLSPREVDVLRLLAEGLSNREIGDRLMISTNTAANHVRSILLKTGASNRTQAAVLAANTGLLS